MTWDRVGASYDRVAGKYEARFLHELQGKPRDRRLLEAFAASVHDPVVEVGCGPGQIGDFVRRRGRSVVGIDVSPEMAKLANGRLDGALAGDMRALPLATEGCGGVLAFYSLIHVRRSEVVAVLREFYRVLRAGARGRGRGRARGVARRTGADGSDLLRARRADCCEPGRRARSRARRATRALSIGVRYRAALHRSRAALAPITR